MSEIVLVHGIAQEQRSADSLESEWIPELAGGVRIAGYPDLADRIALRNPANQLDVRMAFYGDLYLPQSRANVQGVSVSELPDDAFVESLGKEWLERAKARARSASDRDEAAAELAYLHGRT